MRKYNFLLGFILLFILLITPISIICAQELWSYDPSKDLPKNDPLNREWIITAVATSEDAIYTAVGLYREHLVLDEKREVILDDKGLYLMDRQSKLIFLNNKGEEIWSFKTQYAIENIRMSGNGEYIVVGTEEYSFNIDGYCEKVYVFNKSGTPLWTYDGGMFPYVDSSGNVIINTREGFEMYDIRKKLLWRHPNDDLHYIVASDELNLIAVGTAEYDDEDIEYANYKVELFDKNGRELWERKTEQPVRKFYFSENGNLIIAPSLGGYQIYIFDRKGNQIEYSPDNSILAFSTTPDGKYIITRGEKYISENKFTDQITLLNGNAEVLWKTDIDTWSYTRFYDIKITNDGNYIYLFPGDKIIIIDARTGEIKVTIDAPYSYISSLSREGEYLAVGGYKLYLFDTKTLNSTSTPKNVGLPWFSYVFAISLTVAILYFIKNKS